MANNEEIHHYYNINGGQESIEIHTRRQFNDVILSVCGKNTMTTVNINIDQLIKFLDKATQELKKYKMNQLLKGKS